MCDNKVQIEQDQIQKLLEGKLSVDQLPLEQSYFPHVMIKLMASANIFIKVINTFL